MDISQILKILETNRSFKIVFFGDSITSAEWVHPNWREIVEYVLKEESSNILRDWKLPSWGIRCINSGFDGSNSKDWLEKLHNEVLDYKPDMVIVMGTLNDMDMKITSDESKENIKSLLNTLVRNIPLVVYCTDLASSNDTYNKGYFEYVEKVKEIFPFENVLFINIFEEFTKFNRSKFFTFESTGNEAVGIEPGQIDFIHPNQLGNAYIAKIILNKVFEINFDPEKYILENNSGKMFPDY